MTHSMTHEEIINQIEKLSEELKHSKSVDLLLDRAKLYMKTNERNLALNDLTELLLLDPTHTEALSYKEMIGAIDVYFYNQTYNV